MLEYCTEKVVSDYSDKNVSLGELANFKEVALDWLLRQEMYEDIGSIQRWAMLYQKSSNPILRMAYNIITTANNTVDIQTLSKGK